MTQQHLVPTRSVVAATALLMTLLLARLGDTTWPGTVTPK